jgi:hypothetical protein
MRPAKDHSLNRVQMVSTATMGNAGIRSSFCNPRTQFMDRRCKISPPIPSPLSPLRAQASAK